MAWRDSIAKTRELKPENLYLPHFGLLPNKVTEHLDAVEARVVRSSEWFRERLRAGVNEVQLRSEFADYEAADLRHGGASAEDVHDYEQADPSYMAVPATRDRTLTGANITRRHPLKRNICAAARRAG